MPLGNIGFVTVWLCKWHKENIQKEVIVLPLCSMLKVYRIIR